MYKRQLINDTMTEVENQLKNKKLSDYNTQAEVIYLFSLSDKSEDEDLVKNFVSCFKKNQSDEDLTKTEMCIRDSYQPEYSVSGLSGAVFEIYADEDITTPDGTDVYKRQHPYNIPNAGILLY